MYVLVGGVPGSGKTTLARQLAPLLEVPLIAKDAIKEALMTALGPPRDVAESQRWGRAVGPRHADGGAVESRRGSRQHVVPVHDPVRPGTPGADRRGALRRRWTSPSAVSRQDADSARRAPRRPADRGGAVGRGRASAATPRTPRGSRHDRTRSTSSRSPRRCRECCDGHVARATAAAAARRRRRTAFRVECLPSATGPP